MVQSKFEKIFFRTATITACVLGAIFLLSFLGVFNLGPIMLPILLILLILSIGVVSCFSAVKMLLKNKKSIYAYLLIGINALVCLLWVILVIISQNFLNSMNNVGALTELSAQMGYIKFTLFITLQSIFVKFALNKIFKFNKSHLTLQIIRYSSLFVIDLWLTIVVLSIGLGEESFVFSANWLIGSSVLSFIFIVSILLFILSSILLKKEIKRDAEINGNNDNIVKDNEQQLKETVHSSDDDGGANIEE